MHINLGNNLETSQKLIVTPQLQQSIEILQMSSIDLYSFLEQKSLENPVIEIEPDYSGLSEPDKLRKKLEWLDEMDDENRVYYMDSKEGESGNSIVDNTGNTLQAHLINQLNMISLTALEYRVAVYIIQSLNDYGFLETDILQIAEKFKISDSRVISVLKLVQNMEPWGVGARNLKESLIIQLKKKKITDSSAYIIIDRYFEDLAKNRLGFIAKELKIELKEVKRVVAIIRSLNPYPGNSFGSGYGNLLIKPDVVVVKFNNYFQVQLTHYSYPKVNISSYYKNVLQSTSDNETKNYISNKIKEASWIINCIEQRNNTLFEVSKVIVELQKGFFEKGPSYLTPMVLKDVADKLQIHESTVSRALNDKYLQCCWGIFNLKYFFTLGVCSKNGQEVSIHKVKLIIKDIIDSENKNKPYSDQKIADRIKEMGIKIARRTVSKYRQEMNILDAAGRREF